MVPSEIGGPTLLHLITLKAKMSVSNTSITTSTIGPADHDGGSCLSANFRVDVTALGQRRKNQNH